MISNHEEEIVEMNKKRSTLFVLLTLVVALFASTATVLGNAAEQVGVRENALLKNK